MTVSELLVGAHKANSPERRSRRAAFVEAIVRVVPALPFTSETAGVHARLVATVPIGLAVGAHGALIAATALFHGHAVLTHNVKEFSRLPGVRVLAFSSRARA